MAKTKISEFSSTPANNTDIDSINIAEGCAPSGINDAIRELMAQLKDFQTGAQGDSFNGPIGTSTAAAGAFTTLSATGAITSTLATGTAPLVIASTTKVANLNVDLLDGADWASPAALGSTTPAAVSATTLSASGATSLTGSATIFNSATNTLSLQKSGGAASILFGSNTAANAQITSVASGGLFFSTGDITQTEKLRITAAGDVGIGNSSPAYKLDVTGTLGVSSSVTLSVGTANGVAYLNGSKVVTSGSALTFDGTNLVTTQAVSIGTGAAPGARLDIGGQDGTNVFIRSTGTSSARLRAYVNSAESAVIGFLNGGGQFFEVAGSEQMRLTSTGLGIGTSSPTQKVEVTSSGTSAVIITSTSGTAQLMLNPSGTNPAYINYNRTSASVLAFYDNFAAAERMRIDSSGNLLLGTTSNAPAGTQSQFVNKWSGGAKWGASFDQTVSSSTQYTHINFSTNGTTVGYINANNSVTTYNSVSDYRLKTVIGAVSGSGERIDALEPIEYEWKTDGSRTRGFLAHKFQEVYANSVSGTKDAVDEQGNPIYQAMQAGSAEVIADLVAEIQSLRKRLADAGL